MPHIFNPFGRTTIFIYQFEANNTGAGLPALLLCPNLKKSNHDMTGKIGKLHNLPISSAIIKKHLL